MSRIGFWHSSASGPGKRLFTLSRNGRFRHRKTNLQPVHSGELTTGWHARISNQRFPPAAYFWPVTVYKICCAVVPTGTVTLAPAGTTAFPDWSVTVKWALRTRTATPVPNGIAMA